MRRRISEMEDWLTDPILTEADKEADYATVIEVNIDALREAEFCCPNDPDDATRLNLFVLHGARTQMEIYNDATSTGFDQCTRISLSVPLLVHVMPVLTPVWWSDLEIMCMALSACSVCLKTSLVVRF